MRELYNLAVDLDERFASDPAPAPALREYGVAVPERIDERTLAWIDDVFGGTWSSEANAGGNAVATYRGDPAGFATFDPQGLRFAWLRGAGRERGVGIFGPIGVAPEHRERGLGTLLLRIALGRLRAKGFDRALIPAVSERLIPYYARTVEARVVETYGPQAFSQRRARALVMASGSGTNLQAVLDRSRDGALPLDVAAVVVNKPGVRAIERARDAGVPSIAVLPWVRGEESRSQYDERLLARVETERPDLVLLLGWMHLLAEPFVRAFPNLLNVHPAFLPLDPQRDEVTMPDGAVLPAFRGAHAVRDALAAGASWTGASVHVVTPQTDRGPVLARRPMRIAAAETEDAVLERLHPLEHVVVEAGIRRWLYER